MSGFVSFKSKLSHYGDCTWRISFENIHELKLSLKSLWHPRHFKHRLSWFLSLMCIYSRPIIFWNRRARCEHTLACDSGVKCIYYNHIFHYDVHMSIHCVIQHIPHLSSHLLETAVTEPVKGLSRGLCCPVQHPVMDLDFTPNSGSSGQWMDRNMA